MSSFNNATLMITGGTGSFGSTVLKHFLDSDLKEIRIFSRDEKKQDDMRHELQAKHPEAAKKVKFYIGDVRNPQSIKDAMPGVDYIFHAAALKQVQRQRWVSQSRFLCFVLCRASNCGGPQPTPSLSTREPSPPILAAIVTAALF